MNDLMVKVVDLIKVYKSKNIEVVALRGVNLNVRRGELLSIMGPSGSGKTTLLNMIAGIDYPTAGRVLVDGLNISALRGRELEKYRLRKVGYIFQLFNLIPTLTAEENVELPMIAAGVPRSEREKRVRELFRILGLEGREKHFPEELSGGEQQRVAIACALANDPPLILADEPTGELDWASSEKIVEIFMKLSRELGKTIIVSTHDPRVARRTDRIIILEDGLVKGEYSPTKVPEHLTVEREVEAEKSILNWIKTRIDRIDKDIQQLVRKMMEGEIELDEFIQEYSRKKSLREALKEELKSLGMPI